MIDMKDNDKFDIVASIRGGPVKVWWLDEGNTGTSTNTCTFTQVLLGILQPMASYTSHSKYKITGVHFMDDGASMIICMMEDHKV